MAKGYIKIEHDLFRFLYSNSLNASELKVLLFLIRYTKGFNRDIVKASYSYIAKGTDLSIEAVRLSIKKLKAMNLLEVHQEAKGSRASILKLLYKNYTTSYTKNDHPLIQEPLDNSVPESYHQDIKGYKKEDIKDKERVFSWEELQEMQESEDWED